MIPICITWLIHVPFSIRIFFKRIILWVIVIEVITLRENAMAQFIKRSICKCLKCLFNQRFFLMYQCINRRSERKIFCAVLIGKMVAFYLYHSMTFLGSCTFFTSFSRYYSSYFPCVNSCFLRKKTYLIRTISIIETFYLP